MPQLLEEAHHYTADKRACVAMIIRQSSDAAPDPAEVMARYFASRPAAVDRPAFRLEALGPLESAEMLFMLRAANAKDRWSGQVAFPGGRSAKNETDQETVARECWEELGIRLPTPASPSSDFTFVGYVHDRVVMQSISTLCVSCLVFVLNKGARVPPMRLSAKEVAAVAWCPVAHLLKPDAPKPLRLSMEKSVLGVTYPVMTKIASQMGVSSLLFVKVQIPVRDMELAPLRPTDLPLSEDEVRPKFFVWGMTLAMINDALYTMTKVRSRRVGLRRGPMGLDVVFDSTIHNAGVALARATFELLVGRPPTWAETVRYYVVGLTGTAVGVPLIALGAKLYPRNGPKL